MYTWVYAKQAAAPACAAKDGAPTAPTTMTDSIPVSSTTITGSGVIAHTNAVAFP
jgi:hypothetical protein